jgi:hypothetical protein
LVWPIWTKIADFNGRLGRPRQWSLLFFFAVAALPPFAEKISMNAANSTFWIEIAM